jgi:hypothetical protein
MSVLGGMRSLLDMALDRTVAPGYTSVGYRLRQAGWADDPAGHRRQPRARQGDRGGRFWHDRRPRPQYYLPLTRYGEQDLELLWRYCADAIGFDEGGARPGARACLPIRWPPRGHG